MRIRFLRDEIYETVGPKKGIEFKKDDVVDARADFADRWIRRGSAAAMPGEKDPGAELFVRVRGKAKAEAVDLAHQVEGAVKPPADPNAHAVRADRVERRGVKYFAMAGDERLGAGMDLAAAQAFAEANGGLAVVGAPAPKPAPAPEAAAEAPGKTLPDGTSA